MASMTSTLRGSPANTSSRSRNDDNKKAHVETLYGTVAEALGFQSADHEFWWRTTAVSLGSLLASCQYSKSDQVAHLRWYHRFILPALGPRPIAGVKPTFEPCPTFDGSACELSINWKERRPGQTVRFTIEATGWQAGTPEDPFNQEETLRLLRGMAKEVPDMDLRQFEHFVNEFFLPSQVAKTLIPDLPPATPLSQAWVAFDLLCGKLMAKVYFMPILKWLNTGIPTNQLVYEAIGRSSAKHGTYEAAIALFDDYVRSFAASDQPRVEMMAIDCVDSPTSRIKMYLRTSITTLSGAKDTYTFGGRLSGGVVDAGLEALSELWPILFRLGDSDAVEQTQVLPAGSYCGFAVEMRPGRKEPEMKIHIPVRKIKGTDAQLCDSLSTWFARRGHGAFSKAYKGRLEAAFPGHNLDHTNGTHTFVSFSYTQEAGAYMTMYYSTKIFGVHVKKDIWEGYDKLWTAKQER